MTGKYWPAYGDYFVAPDDPFRERGPVRDEALMLQIQQCPRRLLRLMPSRKPPTLIGHPPIPRVDAGKPAAATVAGNDVPTLPRLPASRGRGSFLFKAPARPRRSTSGSDCCRKP